MHVRPNGHCKVSKYYTYIGLVFLLCIVSECILEIQADTAVMNLEIVSEFSNTFTFSFQNNFK